MKHFTNISLITAIVTLIFYGCSGSSGIKIPTSIQNLDAPEWVLKGSGAFGGEKEKVFYGVGVADIGQSESTVRSQGDTRARAKLAQVFKTYNTMLTKDYQSLISSGTVKGESEAMFERAIKQVSEMTLTGSEIVDHWQNPESGALYVLARLDLDKFKNAFEKLKRIDSNVKDYIRKNADRLYKELEEEVEKGSRE